MSLTFLVVGDINQKPNYLDLKVLFCTGIHFGAVNGSDFGTPLFNIRPISSEAVF